MPHQPPHGLNAARLAILGHRVTLAPAVSAHSRPEPHRAHSLPQVKPQGIIGAMAQRCHTLKHPTTARYIPQGLPQAARQVYPPPLACLGLPDADPLPLKLPRLQRQHVTDAQPRMPRHPQRQPVGRRLERRLYRIQRLIRYPIRYSPQKNTPRHYRFCRPPLPSPQGGSASEMRLAHKGQL